MSKLHIICPVINCLHYTQRMVSSIKTEQPFKLTIIDNQSSDGTDRWCEGQDIDCIRNDPRKGLSESWNMGFRKAMADPECEYIFVPNNDVVFHPRTIDNLIRFIDKTGYAMVTGNNQNGVIPLEMLNDMDPPDFDELDLRPITNWREEGPDFSCFLVKKDFVDKFGYFDENFLAYMEDNCMHNRIHLLGEHARRISTAPYFHFGSITLVENPGLGVSAANSMPYFIEKWGATPENCMDGGGYKTPYNDPTKDLRYWKGCEKYN